MNLFDLITLLLTGLVAAYLVFRLYQDYQSKDPKPEPNIPYMVAFTVLLVSGLLLIFLGWGILPNPLVIVVTTFIPLAISVGLYCEFHKEKLGTPYKIFVVVGLLAIILTRFIPDVPRAVQVITLVIVHSVAGLSIFFIPILAIKDGKAPKEFIYVTVGGTLIGLGGIALAFLKSGGQLLFFSPEFVMAILAPLLLLMALAFTWGFMKKMKA
ncbi:MAG: hypothetical protein ABFS12_03980 [Bacteroidota bacterium]